MDIGWTSFEFLSFNKNIRGQHANVPFLAIFHQRKRRRTGKFNDTPDSILELIDEVDLEKIDEVIDIILETDDPEKVEEILKK